jgi:hypothetical protein
MPRSYYPQHCPVIAQHRAIAGACVVRISSIYRALAMAIVMVEWSGEYLESRQSDLA